jgi:hypothetical protein
VKLPGHPEQNHLVPHKDNLDNYLKFLYFLCIALRFWAYYFGQVQRWILAKLVRLSKLMTDAILTVMKYVSDTAGEEPSQEEIANALKNYFILNEIGNQIKFQRKKKNLPKPPETDSEGPFWTLNLLMGPSKNSLARIGLFYQDVQDAITVAGRFVKDATGDEPSESEIAQSLMSTFIMSEIKNQIDWQRNGKEKVNKPISLTK